MPDRVVEHRCPSYNYQIPLLGIGGRPEEPCPECAAGAPSAESVSGVEARRFSTFYTAGRAAA